MTPTRLKPAALAALAVLSTVCVLPLLSSAIAADDKKNAHALKPALTVTTGTPQSATLPIRLAANGNVAAWQEAVIGSESGGLRLAGVRVNVGDVVKKGQLLAVFAPETVAADVAQARAAVQEAQANAAAAKSDAQRARALKDTGAFSEQQIMQYETAERTAVARVAAAQAALDQQQLRLKYTQVVAPDSGIISSRSATVGAVVGVGTELFRLIRGSRLEWRAEVTSAELAHITPGTKVEVRAASGSELTGRVRTIGPTVDTQTRNALVYVDLPTSLAPNAPFKAGMFATGHFQLGDSAGLTVPQQAIAVRDGFSYVFRLNRDQHVSQLKVNTGRRVGDRVEVTAGLPANSVIVVTGAGFLNDGDLVRTVPAAQPALARR
ncbi:MAG: efflux RND transporter periplasmic adaptor subunit [Telluria sp.]